MHKLKLLILFYKSTLTTSVLFSITVAIIGAFAGFIKVFGITFMTGGWIISLFYKDITYKNEYVFYQNMGITKLTLLIFAILLNILIGLFCIVYDPF